MHAARAGRSATLAAIGVAVALVMSMSMFAPAPRAVAASGPSADVTVTSTTGPEGFQHPGVGVTADNLRHTQEQVAAGVEPWASYFDAMAMTSYAATTLTSRNQGSGDGVPASDAFDSRGINARFIPDSLGAYTQALMYLFTGERVYRENALKIVRVWSHMDPDKFAAFPDAHIHTGVPLYRMVAAAELLRSTSLPAAAGTYPLEWNEQDTADLSANLIVPMTELYLHDYSHYMNQHSFPLIGAIAGYVFTDDRDGYDEAVEWFTLNATSPNQDINGALGAIFRVVEEEHPLNTYGRTFVQHQEMGRDQAHAGGDVNVLTTLARLVHAQGTRLDPATGVPSERHNAVTPYAFLGNRLLRGADAYTGFMMGHEVPWVDLTGAGGHVSEAYRGRWSNTLNELYHVYTGAGVDVGKVAPYLAEQYRQSDGALFYNGNSAEIGTVVGADGLRSFWGGSDPGAEYWLSLPETVAGDAPPVPEDPTLQFEEKGASIGKGSELVTEGDRTFLRIAPARKATTATTLAMRSMSYGARTDYSPVGILVRSRDASTLEVSSRVDAAPYHRITIPDTGGEWRYIVYDMDTDVVPLPAMGDNHIAFYTVTGNRDPVDFDLVNLQAPTQLTPPRFPQGATATIIGVTGSELSASFTADDAGLETLAYSAVGAPAASALDSSNGRFTWTPQASDAGDDVFVVQATDGTTTTALAVTARIASDREGAYQLAREGFDPDVTYTSVSHDAFDAASEHVRSLFDNGTDADFAAAIAELQVATRSLEVLNPRLADGTLDYPDLVTSTLGTAKLGTLVDDDSATFSGDLRVNSFTLDFGADFRVNASAFTLQARYGFGNRSQGTNVYGSNDNTLWTKLTTQMTTNTGDPETLAVADELQGVAFRFIKVQVDEPGVPTDPNFPGIFSVAELKIHGDRIEAINAIESAAISSTNVMPGRAVNGDTVTLSFTSREPITGVAVTIEGAEAGVLGDGTSWTASTTLPDEVGYGRNLAFRVDYVTEAGVPADPLTVTTDGSTLFLSNETTLIGGVPAKVSVVGPTGELETGKAVHVDRMFDQKATTFSDVGPFNGQYYITLDFHEGGAVALTRAEALVRQDDNGLRRAVNSHLQGSNDNVNWTRITNNATSTLAWQTLDRPDPSAEPVAYRYIRITNTDWINFAELRLFGTYTEPPASFISTAKISSSNAMPNLAVPGDTITLSLTATEPLSEVHATIDGEPVTATSTDGVGWTATVPVPTGADTGRKVGFRVEYTNAAGDAGRPVVGTTDASSVFLTTDDGLIVGAPAKVSVVGPTGEVETGKVVHVDRLFDQKATTFSDVGPINGQYYITLDFHEGGSVALTRAEALVRQDDNGLRRAANTHIQGSNDNVNWTRVTVNATGTLAWQTLGRPDAAAEPVAYRYLRITNTDWINLAELRLFGTHTAPPQ
ncbi:hypothetical protein [Agromyces sp. Soil535]|uniref:hypothetical protein n=1 Tax=Agromyces sp. Soil535 TaxID=1736390 RepID=UPI0006FF15C0|nr:hypothetical protein [Agromyces sp. Soil535]KRE30589.1 hypothetical protein ASG80_17835 [Agromyces sp. Soil535]